MNIFKYHTYKSEPWLKIPTKLEGEDPPSPVPKPMLDDLSEDDTIFLIERDDSYKIPSRPKIVSSLSLLLEHKDLDDSVAERRCVFLFESSDHVEVYVHEEDTVGALLSKAVSAYKNSEFFAKWKFEGPFKIWMAEEPGYQADHDLELQSSMQLKNVNTDSYVMVVAEEITEDVADGSIKVLVDGRNVRIDCPCLQTVGDIIGEINRIEERYRPPDDYEINARVANTDLGEIDICPIPKDLPISQLQCKEIILSKKQFVDTPQEPIGNTQYSYVSAPNYVHLTLAEAFAYKEYHVTKVNKRGRKQARVLGIDQLKIYNMTSEQAKQLIKQKNDKGVLANKIQGLFRDVTHRPYIFINQLLEITQDSQNACVFFIEYSQDHSVKKSKFKAETPALATEIVTKLKSCTKWAKF